MPLTALRAGPPATPWRVLLIATVATLLAAGVGASFTDLGPWYQALKQPPWKPPDIWFGPAWTLIYTCIILAGAQAWAAAATARWRRIVLAFYGANAVLQVAWSWFFFRLQRPDWALWEVLALWASIVLLIGVTARLRGRAAWLLLPYLAWVSFAAAINAAVVRLNGPF